MRYAAVMKSLKRNDIEGETELPLITVITLSYNSVYLPDAIDSVLSQTYPHIEYIIADDGSENFNTDELQNYIARHSRGNIKSFLSIHSEINRGTVKNYNDALRKANGKYIFPLAADDQYVDEKVLFEWTSAFEKTDVPVICAYCDNYDERMERFIGRWPRPDYANQLLKGDAQTIYRTMERIKIIPGATMARTKTSLDSLGYFDENYRLLEDYPFAMQVLRKGIPIGFWPKSAVKRRSGGVSDLKATHPQLLKDMELFYENEVYRYAENPDRIKRFVLKNQKENAARLTFESQWETAGIAKKIELCARFPKCAGRKIYHKLCKI